MSNPYIPQQLENISKQIAAGERPRVTVRTLLSWFFGSQRRGHWIVSVIREALNALNLKTDPDFDWTYLDAEVIFLPQEKDATRSEVVITPGTAHIEVEGQRVSVADSNNLHFDPTRRVGRLEIAHRPPISVPPDATIQEAVTIMLMKDYSQLPVMTSAREVKGLFSWRSFGSLCSQRHNCEFVRDALEDHCEVSVDDSLFQIVALIKDHDCVLVRDTDKKITGIITPYDISAIFGQLAEPFLILGEIENHIRALIDKKFTEEELAAACDPSDPDRKISNASDMTFGEYIRLIENPDQWAKLGLHIDRVTFKKTLDDIRKIRNDVMHFDPEGTDDGDMKQLRDFVSFLQRLQRLNLKNMTFNK